MANFLKDLGALLIATAEEIEEKAENYKKKREERYSKFDEKLKETKEKIEDQVEKKKEKVFDFLERYVFLSKKELSNINQKLDFIIEKLDKDNKESKKD